MRLAALNLSGNPALELLDCHNTILTSLDVSASPKLSKLYGSYSKLATLNTSNNPALTYLDCYSNNLTAVNVTSCAALQQLICGHNSIAALDVSKNTMLDQLGCADNKLTSLEVSKNAVITQVRFSQNELSATALNNLFTSLRSITQGGIGGAIDFSLNPGAGTCDPSIARNKGWTILGN